MRRFRILVSNDDGIQAVGVHALLNELHRASDRFDVRVVCPSEEQSGRSHAITLFTSLEAERVELPGKLGSIEAWKVDGTPADCVKLALAGLWLPEAGGGEAEGGGGGGGGWRPDLVVSGINQGANVGLDCLYSGTVGAAMEGNLMGVPSVALSMGWPRRGGIWHWSLAAEWSLSVIDALSRDLRAAEEGSIAAAKAAAAAAAAAASPAAASTAGMPTYALWRGVCVNVNFPNRAADEVVGWRLTRQGHSYYATRWVEQTHDAATQLHNASERAGSRRLFRLEGSKREVDSDDIYDGVALGRRCISVALLNTSFSPYHADPQPLVDAIRRWPMFADAGAEAAAAAAAAGDAATSTTATSS